MLVEMPLESTLKWCFFRGASLAGSESRFRYAKITIHELPANCKSTFSTPREMVVGNSCCAVPSRLFRIPWRKSGRNHLCGRQLSWSRGPAASADMCRTGLYLIWTWILDGPVHSEDRIRWCYERSCNHMWCPKWTRDSSLLLWEKDQTVGEKDVLEEMTGRSAYCRASVPQQPSLGTRR